MEAKLDLDKHVAFLAKGAEHLIEAEELKAKLSQGKPLTVKVGFDPSAPDLHLGHTVILRKMKHFQMMGHRVIFLLGDFTGLIGDPSGKKSTRPQLTKEEVRKNAETYQEQVFTILDREKTIMDFNSRWLGRLGSEGWIRLAGKVTLARILERDDFQKRFQAGEPIYLHELLYPLAQAYDSVFLKADVELGGTDQLFNLLMGRNLMREYGLPPQVVLTMPLLEGLDGKEKMSKSLNNAIALKDPPKEMFGKIMSISDTLMWKYYLLLTDFTPEEIENFKKEHPMEAKKKLAFTLTSYYHGIRAAQEAQREFEKVFSQREMPSEIPQYSLPASTPWDLPHLLKRLNLVSSTSEARRLIQQGGVSINGEKIGAIDHALSLKKGETFTIRVGKRRWAQVTLT